MPDTKNPLNWEANALRKYQRLIVKIPLFHREIAKTVVDKKAVINARERGSKQVEEKDIVQAFQTEVPKAFYSLMIRLFDEVGFNYKDAS
jgi:ABC-type multidrug transport system permease subunit